jgi:carboxyl-terminal processing protease
MSMRLAAMVASVALMACGEAGTSPAKFQALSARDQNLAVYDAFVENLEDNYFDPKLLKTPEWKARFAEFRRKAAEAPDRQGLYNYVLFPIPQKFPQSHVSVVPPANLFAAAPATDTSRYERLNALWLSGPGFDNVTIRRGTAFNFIVGDVIKGSPAERLGITPGWVVDSLSLDPVAGEYQCKGAFLRLSQDEARGYERALGWTPAGVKTQEDVDGYMKAHRVEVAYDFELLPARTPFETRQIGDVTYLRFDNFMDPALLEEVLSVIDKAGPKGLIVDLRHNSGGLTTHTEQVLGRLLGNDAYIGTNRKGWYVHNWRTPKKGPSYSGPLAVLIGPSSASAAEITASAVLDNKRGRLLGRMTNGSVLTSQEFPLPDGGSVQVPILDFVRGGDRRIEGVGVEPDIWILPTLEDVRAGRDPVLERALQELGTT